MLWGTLQIPMLLKALLWTRSVRGNSQRPDQNPCLMFNFNSDFPSTFYKSVSELTNTEHRETRTGESARKMILRMRVLAMPPPCNKLICGLLKTVKILIFIQRRKRKYTHRNSQNQVQLSKFCPNI